MKMMNEMKKKVIVTMTAEFEIEIPDEETVLHDYRSGIQSNADMNDIFEAVAWNETIDSSFTEGVGREDKDYIILSAEYDYDYETEDME